MNLAEMVAAVTLASLVLYAVLGGADFGGGVWDLLSSGPRAKAHRQMIEKALAPVWEANHVWLILVVVLLFTGFPTAFSVITTALHIPLTLLLLGIVLRGSAFTFRHYDSRRDDVQRRWGRIFAIASTISPLLLGTILGAITAGQIRVVNGIPTTGFFESWLAPFPLAIGAFALSLFAFLAAVYLINESDDPLLQNDFRLRAWWAGGAVVIFSVVSAAVAAGPGAAHFQDRLLGSAWSIPLLATGGAASLATTWALAQRKFKAARVLAIALIALIVVGWGLAQMPFVVAPDLTFANSAAPDRTLELLLVVLGIGSLTLFPALYWLFRIFKGQPAFEPLDRDGDGREDRE